MSKLVFSRLESPHLENPYPLYAHIRNDAPVFFAEEFNLWLVSQYEDVRAALKDTTTFLSADCLKNPVAPAPEVLEVLTQGYPAVRALVDDDPPSHTRMRTLTVKALSPQRMAAMEPRVRVLANSLLDEIAADGEADIVARFTYPLPAMVIGELLGVPEHDIDQMKKWAEDLTIFAGGLAPLARQIECARGFVALQHYLGALVANRRRSPGDDVVSTLIEARQDGIEPLSDIEIVGLLQSLHFAGHETTTNLIGNALLLLLGERSRWEDLLDAPSLIPDAVEEVLRMDAPVQGMMRTTSREVEIHGVKVPQGAKVLLMFASANRDAAEFAEPDRFDLNRAFSQPHLAFGRGIHFCVGAPLARIEAKVALELLGVRLKDLHLVPNQPLSYLPNFMHRGPQQLRVSWRPSERGRR
jgi:cytochrome P450